MSDAQDILFHTYSNFDSEMDSEDAPDEDSESEWLGAVAMIGSTTHA